MMPTDAEIPEMMAIIWGETKNPDEARRIFHTMINRSEMSGRSIKEIMTQGHISKKTGEMVYEYQAYKGGKGDEYKKAMPKGSMTDMEKQVFSKMHDAVLEEVMVRQAYEASGDLTREATHYVHGNKLPWDLSKMDDLGQMGRMRMGREKGWKYRP